MGKARRMKGSRTIRVDYLARVEGEGALYVRVRDGRVAEVRLRIFEPPRLFESMLRGRHASEAPDITARICGICPVAYQMSAVHAVEQACGVRLPAPLRALRRLLYCGEWIESHTLHVHMLHAPDFLGYPSAIHLAKDHPGMVRRGLDLKKAGNAIVALVGGREIHPINVRVGGFHRLPTRGELGTLVEPLKRARDLAREVVRWTGTLQFPEFAHDYEFVAMRHPDEYPMNEGRLVTSRGDGFGVDEFDVRVEERQVPHSTALHASLRGRGAYLVGPMARWSLNADHLPGWIRDEARGAGLDGACLNPFRSITARAVEVLWACDEALRLIEGYEPPESPAVEIPWCAGVGYAATEAPRGVLYHRYELEPDGTIREARIVPPTSQNQATIEDDLRRFVPGRLAMPEDELRMRCEQVVRNHDPCISCATHFLKLQIDNETGHA